MRLLLALTLAAAVATPAVAGFTARNLRPVVATGPETFAVQFRYDDVTREFWCAAGDYVMHGLGRGPATRIWRISGPQRGTDPMEFSLSPEGAQPTGLLHLNGSDNLSMTASHAFSLCDTRRIFPDEDFN